MSEKTATQVRLEIANRELVSRLMSDPIYQAERIAHHYLAHVTISEMIMRLLRKRHEVSDTTAIDATILRLTEDIKTNHAHDFGIELRWNVCER